MEQSKKHKIIVKALTNGKTDKIAKFILTSPGFNVNMKVMGGYKWSDGSEDTRRAQPLFDYYFEEKKYDFVKEIMERSEEWKTLSYNTTEWESGSTKRILVRTTFTDVLREKLIELKHRTVTPELEKFYIYMANNHESFFDGFKSDYKLLYTIEGSKGLENLGELLVKKNIIDLNTPEKVTFNEKGEANTVSKTVSMVLGAMRNKGERFSLLFRVIKHIKNKTSLSDILYWVATPKKLHSGDEDYFTLTQRIALIKEIIKNGFRPEDYDSAKHYNIFGYIEEKEIEELLNSIGLIEYAKEHEDEWDASRRKREKEIRYISDKIKNKQ
jgi:hypothetical protein